MSAPIAQNLPGVVHMLGPYPVDERYGPFASVAAAKSGIPSGVRHGGLLTWIQGDGIYGWLDSDLTDTGLIPIASRVISGNGVTYTQSTKKVDLGPLTQNTQVDTLSYNYLIGQKGLASGNVINGFGMVSGYPQMTVGADDYPNTLFTNRSTLDFAYSTSFPSFLMTFTASNNITSGVTMYFCTDLSDVVSYSIVGNSPVATTVNLSYVEANNDSLILIKPNDLVTYPWIQFARIRGHSGSGSTMRPGITSLTGLTTMVNKLKTAAQIGVTYGLYTSFTTLTSTFQNITFSGTGTFTANQPMVINGVDIAGISLKMSGTFSSESGSDYFRTTFSSQTAHYTGTGGGGAFDYFVGSYGTGASKFVVDMSASNSFVDFKTGGGAITFETTQESLQITDSSGIIITSGSSTPMSYDSDYNTAFFGDRTIPDVGGVKNLIATYIGYQFTDSLVQSPSSSENMYVIAWDNGANSYTLVPQASGGGGGSVSSVGLSAPSSVLSVSGSPVTVSGTLALSLATQSSNTVWAGPTTGSAATPTFRALVTADLPNSLVTMAKLSTTGTANSGSFLRGDGAWTAVFTNTVTNNHEHIASDGTATGGTSTGIFSNSLGDISLGGTGTTGGNRTIVADGSSTNINVDLRVKGTGFLTLSTTTGLTLRDMTSVYTITFVPGSSTTDPVITGGTGGGGRSFTIIPQAGQNGTIVDGGDMKVFGADAYTSSGNGRGGDVIIRGGLRRTAGAGRDGNILLDPRTGYVIMPNTSNVPTPAADTAGMFVADIVAGNAAFQFKTELGQLIKLYTTNAGSAYNITNGTTDRTYDANLTTIDEIADILYTLIQDLKLTGIIA